jgi:hypothetical protein
LRTRCRALPVADAQVRLAGGAERGVNGNTKHQTSNTKEAPNLKSQPALVALLAYSKQHAFWLEFGGWCLFGV